MPLTKRATWFADVIAHLRLLERGEGSGYIGGKMWNERERAMSGLLSGGGSGSTIGAFAWGGVWLDSLASAFAHDETTALLRRGLLGDGSALVLGASLGFEAYLLALGFGMRTIGVELLCPLVATAEAVRGAHAIPPDLVRFECADALSWALPTDVTVVYVDDTSWDQPTVSALAEKLAAELPRGAVVVHNHAVGYDEGATWRPLHVVEVRTSWNPAHLVHVHALA